MIIEFRWQLYMAYHPQYKNSGVEGGTATKCILRKVEKYCSTLFCGIKCTIIWIILIDITITRVTGGDLGWDQMIETKTMIVLLDEDFFISSSNTQQLFHQLFIPDQRWLLVAARGLMPAKQTRLCFHNQDVAQDTVIDPDDDEKQS